MIIIIIIFCFGSVYLTKESTHDPQMKTIENVLIQLSKVEEEDENKPNKTDLIA